jgi:hypothetical protein
MNDLVAVMLFLPGISDPNRVKLCVALMESLACIPLLVKSWWLWWSVEFLALRSVEDGGAGKVAESVLFRGKNY